MSFTACEINECGSMCDGWLPVCWRHRKYVSPVIWEEAERAARAWRDKTGTYTEYIRHCQIVLAEVRERYMPPKHLMTRAERRRAEKADQKELGKLFNKKGEHP